MYTWHRSYHLRRAKYWREKAAEAYATGCLRTGDLRMRIAAQHRMAAGK